MINFTSDFLEFRGLKNVTSKKGNVYYVLNCEDTIDGSPFAFCVTKAELIPPHIKKGDRIKVVVNYTKYKELIVKNIVKQ